MQFAFGKRELYASLVFGFIGLLKKKAVNILVIKFIVFLNTVDVYTHE